MSEKYVWGEDFVKQAVKDLEVQRIEGFFNGFTSRMYSFRYKKEYEKSIYRFFRYCITSDINTNTGEIIDIDSMTNVYEDITEDYIENEFKKIKLSLDDGEVYIIETAHKYNTDTYDDVLWTVSSPKYILADLKNRVENFNKTFRKHFVLKED